MRFSSEEIAQATGGEVLVPAGPGAICTDTRSLTEGDWFLAIVGDRFDGHRFLVQAKENGAAGCIVSATPPMDWTGGCVRVGDTSRALQDLGRAARKQFRGPVIGLTGTTGKTTTRAMVACALAARFRVHQTQGNLNNHLGVPMTLIATPEDSEVIVVEMGTSSPGEIGLLAELADPDVRIVLNVGAGHLEDLGGLAGVAKEKGALIRSASPDQWVVINIDDPWVCGIAVPAGVTVLSWGVHEAATIRLVEVEVDGEALTTRASYETPEGLLCTQFSVPGAHLAHNGACALAVAHCLGVPLKEAIITLGQYEPVGMRQRVETLGESIKVINDAYNANPVSMRAALETLSGLSGRRVAVIGDMLELGPDAVSFHVEVLKWVKELQLDAVFLTGTLFESAREACPVGVWFETSDQMVQHLMGFLSEGDCVLFKGSRGSRIEEILRQLQLAHRK